VAWYSHASKVTTSNAAHAAEDGTDKLCATAGGKTCTAATNILYGGVSTTPVVYGSTSFKRFAENEA